MDFGDLTFEDIEGLYFPAEDGDDLTALCNDAYPFG